MKAAILILAAIGALTAASYLRALIIVLWQTRYDWGPWERRR